MTGLQLRTCPAIALVACLAPFAGASAQPATEAGPSFGRINPEQMARMVNPADEEPFYMINLIQFREKAVYPDGRETDLTGRQANSIYNPVAVLQEIGAQVVFVAEVEEVRQGDGVQWDQVAIVRYPSRRAFLQMTQRPDFRAKSIHKDAGVGRTTVMVTHLVAPLSPTASAEDRPNVRIDVLRYRGAGGAARASADSSMAGRRARFEVEGVFIGDGRSWDEVRITRSAGPALETEAGEEVADSYTIQARPIIYRLTGR